MERLIKTFEEFSDAVESLASGRYFAVRIEKTKYSSRDGKPRDSKYDYTCYVQGYTWFAGISPEEAIHELKKGLGLVPNAVIEAEIQ